MPRIRFRIGINKRCYLTGTSRFVGLLFVLVASTLSGWARTRLSPESPPQYADMEVLASRERRADFSCQVIADKPGLGFDLRFHSDYHVTVPIKVLANVGGGLQVLMRVTPAANRDKPVYLVHRFSIPDVPPGAKGDGVLSGGFDLGRGRYQVDWMMRDGRGRICSSHWASEAKLRGSQQDLPLTLDPNMVAERAEGSFGEEPPVEKVAAEPLDVKVLLNLSPLKPQQSILKPIDRAVLLSILRGITLEPGVRHLSLVAFNLREQKVIYRQEDDDKIDFAALDQAAQSPTAGTISYRLLKDPRSETHFVTKLLIDQLGARASSPDAIIIIGPKVTLEKKAPLDPLREGGAAACPIFYLNYNPNPFEEPWRDTIGSALKAYKGAMAYDIVMPRDLGVAMRDMLSRMGKRSTAEAAMSFLLRPAAMGVPDSMRPEKRYSYLP
jgi:hypothetical protein